MPNGYGSVYKLSGNRRKPWAARKTKGWTTNEEKKKSQPIYEFIGFYEKRQDALTALSDYNKDPYDIRSSSITFSEVYDRWSVQKYTSGISESNIKGYKASYLICNMLYDMKFCDIKLDQLQKVIDDSGKNSPTLKKLKTLLSQMFEYAVIHEIIPKERDMTQYIDISRAGNPNAIDREPFSKAEIKKIWKWEPANEYVSIMLMLIYTGVRISELLDLKKENVNLPEQSFKVIDSKTKAGIRTVPIANKILPLFIKWINKNDCDYILSTPDGEHFEYTNYYDSYWKPLIENMGMSHRPHDTRHTCISLLTAAGVDERIIKKIVGHKGQGVTEQVYTHVEIEEMLTEINKI